MRTLLPAWALALGRTRGPGLALSLDDSAPAPSIPQAELRPPLHLVYLSPQLSSIFLHITFTIPSNEDPFVHCLPLLCHLHRLVRAS